VCWPLLPAVLQASMSGTPLTAAQHIFSRAVDRVRGTIPTHHLRAGSSTGSCATMAQNAAWSDDDSAEWVRRSGGHEFVHRGFSAYRNSGRAPGGVAWMGLCCHITPQAPAQQPSAEWSAEFCRAQAPRRLHGAAPGAHYHGESYGTWVRHGRRAIPKQSGRPRRFVRSREEAESTMCHNWVSSQLGRNW
jgi:hypothetical protein